MSSSVTVYGFAPSTFVRTARMTCAEKGVQHELRPLEFKQPSHKALHPFARMPVLQADGQTIAETLAISVFIDEAFDGPPLQPRDAKSRARMFQWISASSHYLYHEVVGTLLKNEGAPASRMSNFEDHFMAFDKALTSSDFLAGNKLSLADLFVAPMLAFVLEQDDSFLASFKGLSAWKERMWSRDSFVSTAP